MKLITYLSLVLVCSSCLSMKSVQQFATESTESVEQLAGVSLTFQALCQRKRQLRDLRQSQVLRTYQDSCGLQQQADSAVLLMQGALHEYLVSLATVASGERPQYDLSPAKDALLSSGAISLEEETLGAYQSLLELLATATTEGYRRRQVQQLVKQANGPLATLVEQLTLVVNETFREAIGQQKEMLYLTARETADSAQTFVERQRVLKGYIGEADYYEQQLDLLGTYAEILAVIKEGHQQLYEQRDKLHRQETITTMTYYLKELNGLRTAFANKSAQ